MWRKMYNRLVMKPSAERYYKTRALVYHILWCIMPKAMREYRLCKKTGKDYDKQQSYYS